MRVSKREQLLHIIPYLKQVETPFFILGNGSNLLVGDKGYPGVILQIGDRMNRMTVEGEHIRVQAGALLSQIAKAALDAELTGFEFASGIPGTIGGGVVMNAGAYDGEMSQVVEQVTVMNREGELLELSGEEMEFGYRTSIIKNRPFIVLQVCLKLVREMLHRSVQRWTICPGEEGKNSHWNMPVQGALLKGRKDILPES